MRLITENFQKHLKQQFATGLSYGSKVTAEVIMDKFKPYTVENKLNLEPLTEEEKNFLLDDIYNLCNITLNSDIRENIKVMNTINKLSFEKLTNLVDLDDDNSIIENPESKNETNENNNELKGVN